MWRNLSSSTFSLPGQLKKIDNTNSFFVWKKKHFHAFLIFFETQPWTDQMQCHCYCWRDIVCNNILWLQFSQCIVLCELSVSFLCWLNFFCSRRNSSKHLYHHFTVAIDTNNIRIVFKVMSDHIFWPFFTDDKNPPRTWKTQFWRRTWTPCCCNNLSNFQSKSLGLWFCLEMSLEMWYCWGQSIVIKVWENKSSPKREKPPHAYFSWKLVQNKKRVLILIAILKNTANVREVLGEASTNKWC